MNSLEIPLDEKLWLVSEAFIRQYGPVSMHIDSFNAAVEEMIPFIIEEKGKIHLIRNGEEHYTEFSNPYFGKPIYKEDTGDVVKITPKVCMDRSITYASSLYCDIIYKGPNGQINKLIKKHIGDIPIPVYSNLCNLINIKYDFEKLASLQENINDPGGYFLIKGSPKVIVPQVRPSHNNIHIYSGKATSSKGKPRFSKYTETRRGGLTSHITTTQVGICTKSGLISVSIPYIDSHSIPIGIVFRALGAKDEEEMASYIFQKEWFDNHETSQLKEAILILTKSFEQSWKYDTPEAGLYYIGQHSKNIDTISSLSQKDTKEDEKSSLGGAVLKVISYAKHLLSTEFLHHVGIGERFFPEKRIYLGYMVRKLLLCHAGILPTSDRDHVAKKRIHTPGMILAQHFYKTFCQLTGKIVSCMEDDIKKKKPVNISSYITLPHIITKAFSSALSANKWSNTGPPQGISQTLDTFNCISILSFLRKFIIPMANEGGKIEPPRHSHGSQWGFACPWETPEGKKVGLVQNIAMGGLVTVGCDHTPIIDILSSFSKSSPKGYILIKDLVDQNEFLRQTRIFVNGIPQGYTSNPVEIVKELKCIRRRLDINPTISITHDLDDGEIRISTEAGRGMRGLIILDQGNMKLTHDLLDTFKNINSSSQRCGISKEILFSPSEESLWMYLLKNGYVELVDKDEEENLNVAVYPSDLEIMATHTRIQYTHCEMTPDMIEGVGVCTSPKNDCNQAPRNIYQAAMAKQSIGVPGLNHHFYRRGKWHCMVYPQKPIVSTRIRRTLGMDDEPMGQNATVAVMPWFGLNQEDSLVLNQDAIGRGFMCSYAFVAHEAIIKHSDLPGAQRYETFEIPTREDYNDFRGNTGKLIQDGKWCYTPSGIEVNKGDILIGMTMTYVNSGTQHLNQILYSKKKTNISIIYDQKWPATVHSVYCGKNGDGYPCIKLVTRQYRKPVRGDKFCYTEDHEVLTKSGWISITDINCNHEVASLRDGKFLVYENPLCIMSFELDEDEDLIHVVSNQVDLCVTAGHNMYVKTRSGKNFEMLQAKDLFDKHVHYKKDAEWEVPGLDNFILPAIHYQNTKHTSTKYKARILPIDSWCMFYGLWLAEGWTREGRSVEIAVNKDRVKTALIQAFEEMDIEYTISETKEQIYCYDKQLLYYMATYEFTGALNKRIGEWAWSLNKEQSRTLLKGMLLGDGHMNNKTPMYDTSSLQLKDDVMRLALHCGWAANAKMRYPEGTHKIIRGKDTVTHADSWRLTIIKTQLTPAVNKNIKNQQNWEKSGKYKKVYCCTMPSGLLYVRNRSDTFQKPVWSSNSASHGQKGTAGEIWPSEKMPFLIKHGYTPNILINPLAFPSRMTIGMLIENTLGVAMTASALQSPEYNMPLCLDGDKSREGCITEDPVLSHNKNNLKYKEGFNPETDYILNLSGDATPFIKSFDIHRVIKAIESMGINGFCEEEVMYQGKKLPALIYNGVVYYQRLKHMVIDKIHARATGRTHAVHRQPTEGRKKKGGFRNGHMERDRLNLDSPVALKEGISVTIESLSKFETVWGFDAENDWLIKSKQIDHGGIEKRKVYIITLQDGRTIKASKYHPFYTEKGNYEEVHRLISRTNINKPIRRKNYAWLNNTRFELIFESGEESEFENSGDNKFEIAKGRTVDRLACSINPPLVDFEADMELCKNWRWNADFFTSINAKFKRCTKYEIFRKSLALARLVGWAICDGHASAKENSIYVYIGHTLDVETITDDIERICGIKVLTPQKKDICYTIRLPLILAKVIREMGIIKGAKVVQKAIFPTFIDNKTPLPILREFLGGLFGADGHTCCLSLHRTERDLMKSVSISWTKDEDNQDSLHGHMERLQKYLLRFNIQSDIQNSKLTTNSKQSNGKRNHEELVLNIPLTHLVRFSEKIGFRYCEHKSIRLSAGASYRRFRENVLRQRQEICDKINELSEYSDKKDENPGKIVQLKKYIDEAVEWFENKEPILHKKAIPTSKCAVRIILGGNNDFKGGFQTVEKYLEEIGALALFLNEDNPDAKEVTYGVSRKQKGVPVYYLEIADIREQNYEADMCDITIAGTESYVVNGVVSHNCMLAQGAPEMVQDRLLYQSDVYTLPVCQVCGLAAIDDGKNAHCRICQTSKIVMVQLPFGTKLLGQELSVLNFVPRMITLPETPMALKEISLPKSDKNVIKQPVSKTLKITEKPSKLAQSKKVVKK